MKEEARQIAAITSSQYFYIWERRGANDKGDGETYLEIVLTWQASHHFHVAHINIYLNDWEGG